MDGGIVDQLVRPIRTRTVMLELFRAGRAILVDDDERAGIQVEKRGRIRKRGLVMRLNRTRRVL